MPTQCTLVLQPLATNYLPRGQRPLVAGRHVCACNVCVCVFVIASLQLNKERSHQFEPRASNVPSVMMGTRSSPFNLELKD